MFYYIGPSTTAHSRLTMESPKVGNLIKIGRFVKKKITVSEWKEAVPYCLIGSLLNPLGYEKTLVARFKYNLLQNIQMCNMSSFQLIQLKKD
jgi:hypothetical protein